jgi:nucleoside-diphosphate-sugar epimerase
VDIVALLAKRQMAHINNGRATGGFLYVDNAVDAIIAAARSPTALGQSYNLSDSTGASWGQYVTALANGMSYKPPWINLSFRAAMTVASAGETPWRVLSRLPGRPPLTRHAVYLLGRDQEFPTGKARKQLGFVSRISFEEGVARSLAWVKDSQLR